MLRITTALIALSFAGSALAGGSLCFDESALAYGGGAYVSNFGFRENSRPGRERGLRALP